jgi:hypothetical protein
MTSSPVMEPMMESMMEPAMKVRARTEAIVEVNCLKLEPEINGRVAWTPFVISHAGAPVYVAISVVTYQHIRAGDCGGNNQGAEAHD